MWSGAHRRVRIRLFDQAFDCVTTAQALGLVDELSRRRDGRIIGAKNVALTVACSRNAFLRSFYEMADLVTVDGRPLVYVSALFGTPLPEMVGGAHLWFEIPREAARIGRSMYLLGGTPQTVEAARRNLQRTHPALRIVGYRNGFFRPDDLDEMIAQVRDTSPDIVYVGLPSPLKEQVCLRLSAAVPTALAVAVGGILEVMAGEKHRAPNVMSTLCLEWVYRLIQDPRRLWKRYLTTNTLFLIMLCRGLVSYHVGRLRARIVPSGSPE